jgi:adenosine deaminase
MKDRPPNRARMHLSDRIAAMPKTEIHIHLEGATTAETYFEIAQRNGVELPAQSLPQWQEFFHFENFNHFIEVYVTSTKLLRRAEDYETLLRRFGAQQAALNVKYTEAFVSCSLIPQGAAADDFLEALRRGQDAVEREHGIRIALIADISREIPESRHRVVELAIAGHKRGVFTGLGLGGPEIGFPPELFTDAYASAREAGLRVVAHAGETGGAKSVRGALDALCAERIGHGVQSLEDEALIAHLRSEQIALEVCPQSNYRLGVAKPGEAHPIRALFDAGIRCTVNSDDPAMFETDLNREYETLAGQGFTWEELWTLNLSTLDSTFLSDADKRALKAQWEQFAIEA